MLPLSFAGTTEAPRIYYLDLCETRMEDYPTVRTGDFKFKTIGTHRSTERSGNAHGMLGRNGDERKCSFKNIGGFYFHLEEIDK